MTVVDKINTWIIRNKDALFAAEFELIKKDFPPEKLTDGFKNKLKVQYIAHLKEEAEARLKKNHQRMNSKNRALMKKVVMPSANADIENQQKFVEAKIDQDIHYFKVQRKIEGQEIDTLMRKMKIIAFKKREELDSVKTASKAKKKRRKSIKLPKSRNSALKPTGTTNRSSLNSGNGNQR